MLDLRVAHDRVGSSADPVLNGHLCYPNNLDQSLNDTTPDKFRVGNILTNLQLYVLT